MSRWNWLKSRPQRLQSAPLEDLLRDIAYCTNREQFAKLNAHIKTWRTRREEAEGAVIERFGGNYLTTNVLSSDA